MTANPTLARMFTFLLALGLASCKPDDDQSKEYGDVPLDEGPTTYAEVYCHLITTCDCAFGVSEDECVATIADQVQMSFDAATAAGLTYHGECLGDNLELADSLGCSTLSDLVDNPDFANYDIFGCKIFSGPGVEGDACTDFTDSNMFADSCAQGFACFDSVCGAFSTTPPPVKQLGESCDPQSEICEDGASCTPAADLMSYSCTALPVEGESCMTTGSCAEPSFCDFGDFICKAPLGEGEACAGGCGDGLYCSDTTMVCEQTKGEGEACTGDDQCADPLVCRTPDEGGSEVCRPEAPLVCGG
jgi:hypothetical protein